MEFRKWQWLYSPYFHKKWYCKKETERNKWYPSRCALFTFCHKLLPCIELEYYNLINKKKRKLKWKSNLKLNIFVSNTMGKKWNTGNEKVKTNIYILITITFTQIVMKSTERRNQHVSENDSKLHKYIFGNK